MATVGKLWNLLGLIVPDAHGVVQRAGGNEGLADADGHAGDGFGVEGMRQELELGLLPLRER